jgi:hypothetical protein
MVPSAPCNVPVAQTDLEKRIDLSSVLIGQLLPTWHLSSPPECVTDGGNDCEATPPENNKTKYVLQAFFENVENA